MGMKKAKMEFEMESVWDFRAIKKMKSENIMTRDVVVCEFIIIRCSYYSFCYLWRREY